MLKMVFRNMNHPGIYLSLIWVLVLIFSPSVVEWKNTPTGGVEAGYVCPPCGCGGHERIYDQPGRCLNCFMPLIENDYPRVDAIEWVFWSEARFAVFHYRLFYPAYFLAILLGISTLIKYKSEPQVLFLLLFFLGHVLYAFRSQLAGTGHSLHAPERWYYFPATFLLASGPALLLYIRHYGRKHWQFSRRDALHFLPAALVILVNLVFFLGKSSRRASGRYNDFDQFPALAEQVVFLISGVLYLWFARQTMDDQREEVRASRKWFSFLFVVQGTLILLWAFMLGSNFFLYNLMSTSLDYHWIWSFTALVSLTGSYFIIFRRELLFPKFSLREARLGEEDTRRLRLQLDRLMEERKPYLDPGLSLQQLAQHLDIKEKDLSELLNSGLDTSFYAYINTFRLEAVKTMLLDPQKQHLTNFAIAQEAGFSSRSTFFNLFKKHVGMTPGAFKSAHKVGRADKPAS